MSIPKQQSLLELSSVKDNSTSISDETHCPEEQKSNAQLTRKKYNVINEEVRKKIIKKLTVENQNIKVVSKEHGLKLSTCKAILQVYLKEGRISKKTTRDRKSKIINTLIVTTVNPINPLQSSVTPYVSISETKTNSKKSGEKQSDIVRDAIKQASDHLQNVFTNNSSDIFGLKVPQSSQNLIQQTFMQAQMQGLNQAIMKNSNTNEVIQGQQFLTALPNTPTGGPLSFGQNTPTGGPLSFGQLQQVQQMQQPTQFQLDPVTPKKQYRPNLIVSEDETINKKIFKQEDIRQERQNDSSGIMNKVSQLLSFQNTQTKEEDKNLQTEIQERQQFFKTLF